MAFNASDDSGGIKSSAYGLYPPTRTPPALQCIAAYILFYPVRNIT